MVQDEFKKINEDLKNLRKSFSFQKVEISSCVDLFRLKFRDNQSIVEKIKANFKVFIQSKKD